MKIFFAPAGPEAKTRGGIIVVRAYIDYIYSYFEKGCRKKTSKCTRQDRKVVWVFSGILHIGLEEIYKFVFLHVENLFFLSGGLYL